MAEGLLRSLYGDLYEVMSTGTEPSGIHPYALRVMKESGIDISRHYSKSVKDFLNHKFDYVVTVCDKAKEACPFFPGKTKQIHKCFTDPAVFRGTEKETLKVFRKVRDEIRDWIKNEFRMRPTHEEEIC